MGEMFKLVISDDEGKTTVVPLVRDEISIGRKEGNTIRLTERNVSRRHARLLKANGAFKVEDLESYNGVKVNGRKIDGSASLNAGDQISIGDYMLALQVDAASARTAALPAAPESAGAATAMLAAPAEPAPPARLVMLSPPAPGAEFALTKEHTRIGRAEDLDAWVNHRSISREHAQVTREGDGYKVVDLGSANGVRLNGQEISSAPLSPGDVLELGQVRFRFVGEGETYVFDTDRTIQMEAIEEPPGMPKAPIFAALGIIAVAVVVAAIFALGGSGDEGTQPVGIVVGPTGPSGGAPPGAAAAGGAYDEAIAACERQLAAGELMEAYGSGARALTLRPDDARAQRCMDQAHTVSGDQGIFDTALRLRDEGHLDESYLALVSLPEGSPLRSRSEFRQIRNALVRSHLQEGRASLRRDPEQALEHAGAILGLEGITSRQRQDAQQLSARAQTSARRPGSRPATGRNAHGGPQHAPPQHASAQHASAQHASAQHASAQRVDPPPPPPPHVAAPHETCSPGAANYTRCIIDAYEGHASGAGQLAQLIAAYRNVGNMGAALRHMQTFVRRYPGNRRAQAFRQILMQRGMEVSP